MQHYKLKRDADSDPSVSPCLPDSTRHRLDIKRYALSGLILLLSVLIAYPLGLRLISQIHYQRAMNFMQQRYYGLAAHTLQKASNYQPKDYKIQRQWANAVYQLGELSPTIKGADGLADKAKARFNEAFRLNPLDAQSAYGLAREEDRLEQLFKEINPAEHTKLHDALPYYELAIRLRPNGILYHYALARYLHRKNNVAEMLRIVGALTRIYPLAYYHLKKEDFCLYICLFE